jgi:tetratricopeptide (TPR) repeat protein
LALAKLSHPSIATIFEFSTQNDTDYLVTEYISGLSLDNKLAAGALSEKEVMGLGIQLAQGLGAAHEQGIVHRDLKPANLRLTSDGRLKILDFGLAQLMPHASELGLTATLTKSQEVTGTLPYMSPEQLRAGVADARSDIWAAGAVLYEMATGERPFDEKVAGALMDDIIHKTPGSPRSVKSEVSPKLEAVILKCLEKEPIKRYQSARELQADLERLSAGVSPLAGRRRLWPMVAATAAVVALLAAGGVCYLRRSPKLTEKDTIVLADFANSTGDPVFDDTLKQALTVALEQSPYLNVLSDRKVTQTMQMMGRSPGDHLTGELARDLCQRVGSKAVLDGSIASLGNQYVLSLSASTCATGDTLAADQVRANGKEQVLNALDTAATRLRGKLGESLSAIQRFDAPVEQATTSSLEALKAYSLGGKTYYSTGIAAALPFYQRAVELDPNFAMAYGRLGVLYDALGNSRLSIENTQKAYELRHKVSERERLYIESHYYHFATGEFDKAVKVYKLWQQTYPRDGVAYGNLAGLDLVVGNCEEALQASQRSLELEPNIANTYLAVAAAHMCSNQFGEAAAVLDRAHDRNLASVDFLDTRYLLAFLTENTREMARLAATAAGKQEIEQFMLLHQGETEAYYGHLKKASELTRHAMDAATRNDDRETAATYQAEAALRQAEFSNRTQARADANAALRLSSNLNLNVQVIAGLALALAGDSNMAEKLAFQLNKTFPRDTTVQGYWLPTIKAALALGRNNPGLAVEVLKAASPNELGQPAMVNAFLNPVYVRGEAYLALRNGSAAATQFQNIIGHRGVALNSPVGALAHLGLARAYSLQGDTPNAHAKYQDFLSLWKDADPEIPILKEAKAEYAKLQ